MQQGAIASTASHLFSSFLPQLLKEEVRTTAPHRDLLVGGEVLPTAFHQGREGAPTAAHCLLTRARHLTATRCPFAGVEGEHLLLSAVYVQGWGYLTATCCTLAGVEALAATCYPLAGAGAPYFYPLTTCRGVIALLLPNVTQIPCGFHKPGCADDTSLTFASRR